MKYKAPYNTTRAFYDVLKNDLEDLDKELRKKGANVGEVLFFAGDKGNIKVIKHLLQKSFKNFDSAFIGLASGNHVEHLKEFIKINKEQRNLDLALYVSAGNGNEEAVKFLLEEGAGEIERALNWAKKTNKQNIVEILEEKLSSNESDSENE